MNGGEISNKNIGDRDLNKSDGALAGTGGILIAGTGSGSGKTTFTCGLLHILRHKGMTPCSFKCGPDYIDPSFHRKALGVPCYNLDPFFTDEKTLRYLYGWHGRGHGISVVEGVMGYYDGLGFTKEASTYAVARSLGVPVALLVDSKGMGSSVMAVVEGFVQHSKPNYIAGVIFNRLAPALYEKAASAVQELGLVPLGYLPDRKEMNLESRHLGLVMAGEVAQFEAVTGRIADAVMQTVDVEGILRLAGADGKTECEEKAREDSAISCTGKTATDICRIAVARDEAFCFLYEDNLNFLRGHGVEIIFFSPLHDSALPECDGLYLSGGYPELYAERLAGNRMMRQEIKGKIEGGMPCIAECGGFLYLHSRMEAKAGGELYSMTGVIDADAVCRRRKGHFGYIEVTLKRDGLLGHSGDTFRAHEFHYWESTAEGADLSVYKPGNGARWKEGICTETLYAGFPHLYFYGSPDVGENFVRAVRRYAGK